MFNRFTERARRVIVSAKGEARRFNHDYIGTEHLLLGLTKEDGGCALAILRNLNMDPKIIYSEVEKLIQSDAVALEINLADIPFTRWSKKVLELSAEEAKYLGHYYIGTEHILLGLVKISEGKANRLLLGLGLDLAVLRKVVLNLHNNSNESAESETISSWRMMFFESKAQKSMELAAVQAKNSGRNQILSEDILLGLLKEESNKACEVLDRLGASLEKVSGCLK